MRYSAVKPRSMLRVRSPVVRTPPSRRAAPHRAQPARARPAYDDMAGLPAAREMPGERDALVRRTELIISGVLRGGVLLSAGVIALGVVLYYTDWLRAHGRVPAKAFPHSLTAVEYGLAHGDPLAVITLGLLLLLATPVVRVAISVITFAVEHDRLYCGITLLVLAILLLSFMLGKAGA